MTQIFLIFQYISNLCYRLLIPTCRKAGISSEVTENILQELLQLIRIFVKMKQISIKNGEPYGIAKRVERA